MNIFIHHRDIRYQDNTTLNSMYQKIKLPITPIFIFPPEQINPTKNKYFSNNLVQFMCESLEELDKDYKKKNGGINFFEGDTLKVLKDIHKKSKIKTIGFNVDYSPYANKRDNKIKKWAESENILIFSEEDMLLHNLLSGDTKSKNSGDPYKVFTPFMKHLRANYKVNKPTKKSIKVKKMSIKSKYEISVNEISKFYKKNKDINVKSGRKEAKKKLKLVKNQKKYDELRNCLTYNTTHLSSYINLGLLSIREVYHHCLEKLGKNNGVITELYWRDFYYNIMHFFPHVVGKSFKENYDKIKWRNNKKEFKAWCEGKTGFPVVDACMRQMNTTGFMHNRGRMIVASFLTKDLLIDWRWGEKYFATQLQDYNVSANNGGWQWAAGTGTDSQPYFRIFNPWTQTKSYDPNCEYIKKWIPELKEVPIKDIHDWEKKHKDYQLENYPDPIVNHKEERLNTLAVYKKYIN